MAAGEYNFLDFPPFHEFEVEYTSDNRSIDPVDGVEEFVGSHHEGLIEDISKIECSECGKLLIDEGSAMTGLCGHLFCLKCTIKLYKHSNEAVNDQDKGRRPVDKKKFEIYIVGGQSRFLYKCKACQCEHTKGGEGEQKIYVRLFSENIMLKKIYTALQEDSGFLCEECKKKGEFFMHPMFNSLVCHTHSENLKLHEFKYTCVWHAYKHWRCKLTIMRHEYSDFKNAPNKPRQAGQDYRVASLDRSNRILYAALYHCACCSTHLGMDLTREKENPVHHHLECGHFIGDRCVVTARTFMNSNRSGIFCIFCNKYIKCGDVQLFAPPSIQLASIVLKQTNEFKKCKEPCVRDVCNFAPCNTLTVVPRNQKPCPWCKVQHHMAAFADRCPYPANKFPAPYD